MICYRLQTISYPYFYDRVRRLKPCGYHCQLLAVSYLSYLIHFAQHFAVST